MANDVELIKGKLDLVEFLRSYLTLSPAGKNFKANCPFHQEKTPSFIISPERKIWHCFGCGEGGDAIKFVMKYENIEFREALHFLGEKLGLEIAGANPQEQKQFGILHDIHDSARDFYKTSLAKNPTALSYLKTRGLKKETMDEFELGFAPLGDSLTLHLIKSGYDVADIVRAGLSNKNIRGLYKDKFQERIVFPISDHMGKIVAFTGRIMPGKERTESGIDLPKYLNSPETQIFNKSKILYGFNKSKNSIVETKSVFLVEGQMDLLMSWQAGIKNIVAVSGTGLTTQHLEKLRRVADTIMVSFDNDDAGLTALERSIDALNDFDFHVKALDLKGYKDPAEAVEKDPDFIKTAIGEAKPAMIYLFHNSLGKLVSTATSLNIAEKKRLIKKLLLKVKNVKTAVEQNILLKELSKISGISETALASDLMNLPAKKEDQKEEAVEKNVAVSERIDLISARLLSLAYNNGEFMKHLEECNEWLPTKYCELLKNPKDERSVIFELQGSYEFASKDVLLLKSEFTELMRNLQIESLKSRVENLREEVRLAQAKGDEGRLKETLANLNLLAQKINELRQ
ncbi:MAG: DNA primase [Patescibacteria group bacterium]